MKAVTLSLLAVIGSGAGAAHLTNRASVDRNPHNSKMRLDAKFDI
jgi:hypothetical protein